jgi:hypothetical protein
LSVFILGSEESNRRRHNRLAPCRRPITWPWITASAAEATPTWVIVAGKGTGKAAAAGAISCGLFGGTFAVVAADIPGFCVVAQVTGAAMSA